MTLTDETMEFVGQCAANIQARQEDLVAHALAQAYVASVIVGSNQSISNARIVEKIIFQARNHGLDLHEPSGSGISLLIRLIHPGTRHHRWDDGLDNGWLDAKRSLTVWLGLLKYIGVDLAAYGEEEYRLFQQLRRTYECERPWDWWHGREVCACFDPDKDWGDPYPTMFAFSYGADLSEWKLWVLHPGDHYAGQFWQMVEEDGLATQSLDYSVPGGWIESE